MVILEMEDIFDVDDFVPGLFHLNLNINAQFSQPETVKKKIGRKISRNLSHREDTERNSHLRDLTFRYENLKNDLADNDVPDPKAAILFLGVLSCRLGKIKESIQFFDTVLEDEPENLNAIAGLVYVCSKVPDNHHRAADGKKKIADLLGRSEVEIPEDELSHRVATCIAEQAYAYAYDIGLTSYEERYDRIMSAIDLYDRAFTLGSSTISVEERWQLYFSMATIFLGLDTLMIRSEERESARLPGFNRMINILKDVIKSDNTYQSSVSWAYLGIFLERQSGFKTTPMSIHDCGFTCCEPVDCYSKAIEIGAKNQTILNRLSKIFYDVGKHELAIGAADMSIQLESNAEENCAGYRARARVKTSLYMRDLSKCKCDLGNMPDRELLEMAKRDLEKILKVNPGLTTYIEIGQVCYFMGVDAFKESFIVDEEGVNSALVYFSKALGCEMGNKLPQLQILRGRCLRIKGEDRNALECFKRAIDLERNGSTNSRAFKSLMEIVLTLFSHGELEKSNVMVGDIDSWVRLAMEKYHDDVIIADLRAITHAHSHELLELCKAMVRARKTTLPRLCMSMATPQGGDSGSKSPPSEVNR